MAKSTGGDSLGDRMKGYESVSKARLVPKMPVLARLDGKAFHTLTRGMEKPWDPRFMACMWATARALCEEVQGCRVAYVQSDEITLLLVDYQDIRTQGWFDYEVQKMCSVSAALATSAFLWEWIRQFGPASLPRVAFDARFWNLPSSEVVICFIWRQQDAVRNSIQGFAHANFSHKQIHHKDQREMMDMLHAKGINWNDYPTAQKRGVCVVREVYEVPVASPERDGVILDTALSVVRHRWIVDEDIPIFTQDRAYIQRFVDAAPAPTPDAGGGAR